MSWVYEIALRGAPETRDALRNWFESGPHEALSGLPDLMHLDIYSPAEGSPQDPYNRDAHGPLMLLMIEFASRDALAAAVGDGHLAAALGTPPTGIEASGAAFERRFYPVGEGPDPAPLHAPFSYVVRYHRPADDEAAFIENYLATHPVTQARLPGIRAIICYLPLQDVRSSASQLADANYMIGNEVVFDHVEDFNTAMASPVRHELRSHFHEFPRFSGANTHYAMTRARRPAKS